MTHRTVLSKGFDPRKGKKEKADAKGLHTIQFGTTTVDLSALEQLVDVSQTRAVAEMMRLLGRMADGRKTLKQLVDELYERIEEKGLDAISPFFGQHPGDLALPRKLELAAAVNRLRTLSSTEGEHGCERSDHLHRRRLFRQPRPREGGRRS